MKKTRWIKSWNELSWEQQKTIIGGIACALGPSKAVKQIKTKNSTFTIYRDKGGNEYGEMFGVKLITPTEEDNAIHKRKNK